jgi:hypothetical protein
MKPTIPFWGCALPRGTRSGRGAEEKTSWREGMGGRLRREEGKEGRVVCSSVGSCKYMYIHIYICTPISNVIYIQD